MPLADDLTTEVAAIFRAQWAERDGDKVPEAENLRLSNDAVTLEGTVLYADITESTALVDSRTPAFAAEIYKTYLHCAAKIIRAEGGQITAYDGDRVMGVFLGNQKNTSATRAGLKINHARVKIINPAIKTQYPNETYQLQATVGVDTSKLFVARTGVRGANDLVWIGRAANHAAKLCALLPDYATTITAEVYNIMLEVAKTTNGTNMWREFTWSPSGRTIYRSNWAWHP